jgi:hypothetical protein
LITDVLSTRLLISTIPAPQSRKISATLIIILDIITQAVETLLICKSFSGIHSLHDEQIVARAIARNPWAGALCFIPKIH